MTEPWSLPSKRFHLSCISHPIVKSRVVNIVILRPQGKNLSPTLCKLYAFALLLLDCIVLRHTLQQHSDRYIKNDKLWRDRKARSASNYMSRTLVDRNKWRSDTRAAVPNDIAYRIFNCRVLPCQPFLPLPPSSSLVSLLSDGNISIALKIFMSAIVCLFVCFHRPRVR